MSGLWAQIPFDPDTGEVNRSSNAVHRQPSRNTGELDRDAFLMLLVTQMQHQDPLNPMDDRDFLAQMAQFSALEQQQHMTRSMELQQAHNMIGKTVYAHFFCELTEQFQEADGPVMSVRRAGNQILLGVATEVPIRDEDDNIIYDDNGNRRYTLRVIETPLDRITFVEDEHFMSRQLQGILDGVANSRDLGLIGRYVQAIISDDMGRPTDFIEGRVEFVRFVGGHAVLMVNGREIFADEVFSVSQDKLVIGEEIFAQWAESGQIREATGDILGITVVNNRAYVNLSDGSRVRLNRIDHLVEALQFRDQHVRHPVRDFNGVVDRVGIRRGGDVYIWIGNNFMEFREFRETGGVIGGVPSVTPPANPGDDNGSDSSDDD